MLPKNKYPAMWRVLAETHFATAFDYDQKVKSFVNKYGLEGDIEIKQSGNELTAKLNPKTSEELKRVSNLFIHENKYKDERLQNVFEGIKSETMEKFLSKFKGVSESLEIEADLVELPDGFNAVQIDLSIGSHEETFEPESLSYKGDALENIGSAAESYQWAAWLGLEDSPFYDEAFVEAYEEDTISQALEQFWHTRSESTYYDELNEALDHLMQDYEPTYKYYVDLDERGEFRAHVESPDGEVAYTIESEPDGEIGQVRDGFMKHGNDIAGLEEYLKQLEIIPKKSSIVKGD